MNILLINHYAGSLVHGMEYRPFYMAREWVRNGHKVTIASASFSHVRTLQPSLTDSILFQEISGITYAWHKTSAYHGNGFGRVCNIATFVGQLFRFSRQLINESHPDVVIASSTYPLDIYPAHNLARKANAKLVFEVHDLWPLSPMELGGMSRWHPFIMLMQAAENCAYRHSDVVVSMLPKVNEYMESHGMAPHKLNIIPNGIDMDEWQADGPDLHDSAKVVLKAIKAQGRFIVGYAGAHGLANSLDTFICAAKLMKSEDVAFVLVGGGPEKKALQQQAREEGLHNVYFLDPVSKDRIPALLQWFDIAYIGLQRQPLFRFGIAPNKLMDYMMAGKTVLMAIDSGNDPVSEAGCGLTVPPENPQAIVQGICSLLKLSDDERKMMGHRGRKYVLENHTYPILAQRFLAACSIHR